MVRLSQSIINTVKRVTQLHHYAPDQFRLCCYDTKASVWRGGELTSREIALRQQFETRIRMALTMLGYDPVHAGMVAVSISDDADPRDWRQCVRDELNANR